MVEDRAMLCAF